MIDRTRHWVLTSRFVLAFAMAASLPAWAHHSVAGAYDTRREVTISGAIVQFQFVYPHPFVLVDVVRDGSAERWHLEMDNRGELAEIGFTETTLRPGDHVSVTGSLARQEPRRLYIMRLERKVDGFGYRQVGNRPQIVKSK